MLLKSILREFYYFIFPNIDEEIKQIDENIRAELIKYISNYINIENIKEIHSLYHGPPNEELMDYFKTLKEPKDSYTFHVNHDVGVVGVLDQGGRYYLFLENIDQSYNKKIGFFHEVISIPDFCYKKQKYFEMYEAPRS